MLLTSQLANYNYKLKVQLLCSYMCELLLLNWHSLLIDVALYVNYSQQVKYKLPNYYTNQYCSYFVLYSQLSTSTNIKRSSCTHIPSQREIKHFSGHHHIIVSLNHVQNVLWNLTIVILLQSSAYSQLMAYRLLASYISAQLQLHICSCSNSSACQYVSLSSYEHKQDYWLIST